MASVVVTKSVSNNRFTVRFEIVGVSDAERTALAKYGEPTVEMGLGFDNGAGLVFTLETMIKKMTSGFPFEFPFNKATDPQAEAKAAFYATECFDRMSAAWTATTGLVDTFTSVTITPMV